MEKSNRHYKLTFAQLAWPMAAIGFAGFFLASMFLAYNGKLPSTLTQNDKLAHFILYGIAAFLGHKALCHRHISIMGFFLPLFPFLFSLFTLGEELAQSFSPNRSLDPMDLVASFIGIAIGYRLAERSKLR